MTLATEDVAARAQRKIALRLLPFLFLLYVTAFIDRVNVSFAGLQMTHELNFSNEVSDSALAFSFSATACSRLRAQCWLMRGVRASGWLGSWWAGGFSLPSPASFTAQFNTIRFLLGLAEGGFFPAVVVYLTHWFQQEQRAKAIAMFMAAIPVANAVGAPIAGLLLRIQWLGIRGWRWLLILEGMPAFGIAALFYLTDWPKEAR